MPRKIAAPTMQDHLAVASTRMPERVLDIIDNIARRQMRTRADMMRALIIERLQDMGLVARHEDHNQNA